MVTIGIVWKIKKSRCDHQYHSRSFARKISSLIKARLLPQAVEEKHPGPGTMFLHVDSKINLRMGAVDLVACFRIAPCDQKKKQPDGDPDNRKSKPVVSAWI